MCIRDRATLTKRSEKPEARLASLRLLDLQPDGGNEDLFKSIVLAAGAPQQLLEDALKRVSDSEFLIGRLDSLTEKQARSVIERLARTNEGADLLMGALDSDNEFLNLISPAARQQLRGIKDMNLARRIDDLLPAVESRADAINRYQASLQLAGDFDKGSEVFDRLCISCHKTADGRGVSFGPPATSFAASGKEFILSNLIDPNREVAPQYQAFQFEFVKGEARVGMIVSEDIRNVTLSLPTGETMSFPRTKVKGMTGLKRSLMPEGLEQAISVDEMADLLAYLVQ